MTALIIPPGTFFPLDATRIPSKKRELTIPAGEILVFTQGDYSDYQIIAVAIACRPVDMELERGRYIVQLPSGSTPEGWGLITYLMTTGAIREVRYFEGLMLAEDGRVDVIPHGAEDEQ